MYSYMFRVVILCSTVSLCVRSFFTCALCMQRSCLEMVRY